MKSGLIYFVFLALAASFMVTGCTTRKSKLLWDKNLYRIGSESSPRTCDINGDGVLDIIMGAGQNERQHSDWGVIALDGKTGDELWHQGAEDQIFGAATFYDVNNDGVKDIFIGGRGNQFMALNGKTGAVLWAYKYHYQNDSILKYARYDFYNSIIIPDQNHDGLEDLLTATGGNIEAAPNSEKERYPGILLVMDSKTGDILAADTMPDGKETYMSPVCFVQPGSSQHTIVFGSGGETISGHLYMTTLDDLMKRNLSQAKILASEQGQGFIAPPSIADVNGDGLYDIIAISHASTVFAISGKDESRIWERQIINTECSNSFTVGYFNEDDIPDFFTFVSKGHWPNSAGTVEVMLSGSDGEIGYKDSLGCTGFSSPVAYDLNKDGTDEVILSINEYDCDRGFVSNTPLDIENRLIYINFKTRTTEIIDQTPRFKNIFSTPWIGDLDNDQYLDLIYCQYFSPSPNLLGFLGMRVKRVSTYVRISDTPAWGAYMGSNGDGIFPLSSKRKK
jgi:outer membrane protein assembly factor BamB